MTKPPDALERAREERERRSAVMVESQRWWMDGSDDSTLPDGFGTEPGGEDDRGG